MALKNLKRERVFRSGRELWELRTRDGEVVESYGVFCERMTGLSPRTQKRYAETLSRFIDYLYEARLFAVDGATAKQVNAAVDAYPLLLRDGSDGLIARIERQGVTESDVWLIDVARALNWKHLKPGSFSNTLTPVNQFLVLSETIARQEQERRAILGVVDGQPHGLIHAVSGTTSMTTRQVARMRQNSMFASVAKFCPKGIKKPRRLTVPGRTPQPVRHERDFPLAFLPSLIAAATSWRDKALWLLLAASGIRTSEAKNLLFCDVDFERQQVFVHDPKGRRFAMPLEIAEEHRFKGRAMSTTYLFPPLRQQFFDALRMYLVHEFVPAPQPTGHQYLFQYVEPTRRGKPLVGCSDTALINAFKAAVERTETPTPDDGGNWSPHSLRHLYGVYMLNDYPIDPLAAQFGLSLVEVQMLMGHDSIQTTKKYARPKSKRIMARLQRSDELMLGLEPSERSHLPLAVLERLESTCD